MENKIQTIYKITYYSQGKLNLRKTLLSYAWFYWKTAAIPFLNKVDYFFQYNKWPAN